VSQPDSNALDAFFDVYDTLRTPLPWASAALAAAAFSQYRRQGGAKLRPLSDFYIGAHAAVFNLSSVTPPQWVQELLPQAPCAWDRLNWRISRTALLSDVHPRT
jgi:hypothetical protein